MVCLGLANTRPWPWPRLGKARPWPWDKVIVLGLGLRYQGLGLDTNGLINITVVLPVDFGILIVYCKTQIHCCLGVCRITNIASTVYSLTPETLHTLRGQETTHMNSHIITTAGLGVPLSTGPSYNFILYVFLYFILLWAGILSMPIFSCMYIYVLLCVLKDQSSNQIWEF